MDKRDFEDLFEEVTDKLERLLRIAVLMMLILLMTVGICRLAKAETYTCVVHKGEWVWLRETPEPNGRQIGRVRFGYEVEADEPENGFLKIDPKPGWMLEGETPRQAFVNAAYFDRIQPEKIMRVNTQGGALAKRETPNGRLICWIKPGVKISVLGWRYANDGSLWAKVYKGGYVKAEYLTDL